MSWFSLDSISIIYTYENDANMKHKLNMNTVMNLKNSKNHFSLTLERKFTELQSKHRGFKKSKSNPYSTVNFTFIVLWPPDTNLKIDPNSVTKIGKQSRIIILNPNNFEVACFP